MPFIKQYCEIENNTHWAGPFTLFFAGLLLLGHHIILVALSLDPLVKVLRVSNVNFSRGGSGRGNLHV